eukprot:gene6364-7093_t
MVLTEEEEVPTRWSTYFEELMNIENERVKRVMPPADERPVARIENTEVVEAMRKMKKGKAVGLDDIPIEAGRVLGDVGVETLLQIFTKIMELEKMPQEWRESILVPIFKNKGDILDCGNCRGIKLMAHTLKFWERIIEKRLREGVSVSDKQFGFMPGRSTTDAIFALRQLIEKYSEGRKDLHCVFIDLEKAYDRVPRQEIWNCLRLKEVEEKYIRLIQDMYENCKTRVRCAQIQRAASWDMMFADDIALCDDTSEDVKEHLEESRREMENRGLKVSRQKTEYLCMGEQGTAGELRMQGEKLKQMEEFKYLRSTVQQYGGSNEYR